MLTTAQAVSTKTEELANKLHDDICESFADSGHFKDDSLIVTPVTPIYDQDTNEIKAYGFWVYFDAEKFDDDVIVNVLKRAKHSGRYPYGNVSDSDKNFKRCIMELREKGIDNEEIARMLGSMTIQEWSSLHESNADSSENPKIEFFTESNNESAFKYFTDESVPEYIFESQTGEFFTEQDVKKHLTEMGFEVF